MTKAFFLDHHLVPFIAQAHLKSISYICQPHAHWKSQPCVAWPVHLTTGLEGKPDLLWGAGIIGDDTNHAGSKVTT